MRLDLGRVAEGGKRVKGMLCVCPSVPLRVVDL